MADIALLVAEEYERRMKLTADKTSISAELNGWCKDLPRKMKMFGIKEDKIESLKKNLEAKSNFALAVSNGFFSA